MHSTAKALESLCSRQLRVYAKAERALTLEHPASVLSVNTGLCRDASVVCSASIDSFQSLIRAAEVQLC